MCPSINKHKAMPTLAAGLLLVAAACGDDSGEASNDEAPQSTDDADAATGFEAIEQRAAEEGALVLYTTVDDSIGLPMFEAFNEEYPEIEITHTLLVTSDAQSRYASERDAGAASADILVLGDHLLYDDQPEWFRELTEDEVPNLANLPSPFNHTHFVDFMSGPYVFAYNTDIVADPPETWEDLVDPEYRGINGSLIDPRASGAFMSGFAFWRGLYGDEFLTELGEQDFVIQTSPSESREQVAAGALGFTAPGVAATLKSFIEAGAPIDYVTPKPVIALTHASAINSEATNPNAALVFLNWLLSEKGQEMACGGQYAYLADYDEVPDCPRAEEDLTIQDAAAAAPEADEISQLLGLED